MYHEKSHWGVEGDFTPKKIFLQEKFARKKSVCSFSIPHNPFPLPATFSASCQNKNEDRKMNL